MKASIITATYNSKNHIADCMKSVLGQDYKFIEYIIIDGASQDGTLDIIKSFQRAYHNIRVISEPDNGIYDALNKGIISATGDVIGFVHSDDMLASHMIISQIMRQFKDYQCDGVYGDLKYVDRQNINKVIRYWKSCNFAQFLLKRGWMPAHPTLFLGKDVYKKHGMFNLTYAIAADYDFILRIFSDQSLKFDYLNEVITKMRVGGASNRSLRNIVRKTKEDYKALKTNKVGGFLTVLAKNISKLSQFYKKNNSEKLENLDI